MTGSRSRLIVARNRVNMTPWLPGNPDSDSDDESTTSSAVVLQRDWLAVHVDNQQQLDDSAANWLVATMLPWSVYALQLSIGYISKKSRNHAARLHNN